MLPNSMRIKAWPFLIILLLAAIGVARIVATYNVFNQTADEAVHIAGGMEWWLDGTYTIFPYHPPLAPIAIGLGPYLAGLRSNERSDRWKFGNEILHSHGKYFRNLAIARLGILPFFLLATFMVWQWGRRLFGNFTGITAAALFATLPPILGHSGVATTDMAITATLCLAVFSFVLWIDAPTVCRSLFLGCTSGLAFLSKFSSLLFLPLCFLSIVVLRFFAKRDATSCANAGDHRWPRLAAIAMLASFFVVFAGYRFSLRPLMSSEIRPHESVDRLVGDSGRLHDIAYRIVESRIFPLKELGTGLMLLKGHARGGHPSYCLGEYRMKGWWYFFPVALAVKTPIPFLVLTLIGSAFVIRKSHGPTRWQPLSVVACSVVILLSCMASTINIGVRHILPIYTFLAILAGVGGVGLWTAKTRRILWRFAFIILLAWQFVGSIVAHPDYLSYFNVVANKNREKILINSDLDWGQDLNRLCKLLKRLGVKEVAIAYAGTADLNKHDLPRFHPLVPYKRTHGWIAISLARMKYLYGWMGFSWLEKYRPVAMAGRSIRVYYIPESKRITP